MNEIIPGALLYAPEVPESDAESSGRGRLIRFAAEHCQLQYHVAHYGQHKLGHAFGPLGMDQTLSFCSVVDKRIAQHGCVVIATPPGDYAARANMAVLIGAYLILRKAWPVSQVRAALRTDAGMGFPCSWARRDKRGAARAAAESAIMHVEDCWSGIAMAHDQKWLRPVFSDDVSIDLLRSQYRWTLMEYDAVWLVPNSILVCADPMTTVRDPNPLTCSVLEPLGRPRSPARPRPNLSGAAECLEGEAAFHPFSGLELVHQDGVTLVVPADGRELLHTSSVQSSNRSLCHTGSSHGTLSLCPTGSRRSAQSGAMVSEEDKNFMDLELIGSSGDDSAFSQDMRSPTASHPMSMLTRYRSGSIPEEPQWENNPCLEEPGCNAEKEVAHATTETATTTMPSLTQRAEELDDGADGCSCQAESCHSVCKTQGSVVPDSSGLRFPRSPSGDMVPQSLKRHAPKDFVSWCVQSQVGTVVRVNSGSEAGVAEYGGSYDSSVFSKASIKQVDCPVPDRFGACPGIAYIRQVLEECGVVENKGMSDRPAILVHCKGGFGRSVLFACCIVIYELDVPGRSLLGWARIARPGAITTPEQEAFLCSLRGRADLHRRMYAAEAGGKGCCAIA